ncbi:MAG TPA: hypothetical protein VFA68_21745 [Terriglobales bacterium]|nr:hypothetical protein [Terriglobales bacterium]
MALPRILSFGLACTLISAIGLAQVSVTTYHNDNSRTGQNTGETMLTPANVNVNQFGKLFTQAVDGYVYAQPLYVPNVNIAGKGLHNVVYVATEHDSVYAFDADTNTGSNASPLWQVSFINPSNGITTVSSSDVSCSDLVPEIGITSTPVIDLSSGTMYVVAKTKERGKFFQRLHALDIGSGAEKFGGPITLTGAVRGNGDGSVNGVVHYNSLRQHQRAALLLQNGNLYISSAAHCDVGPYHGWILVYNASTLAATAVYNSSPNGGLAGFWASGGGPAADASSNLFFATGNGTFDPGLGQDFGDSVLKLAPPSNKRLKVADFFTPYNQDALNQSDADLGSGGVTLLPDQTGAHPHLLVQSGKEGTIYLIDRDKMGHFNPNNNNQIVQSLDDIIGGMWSTPAWWNNNVYFGGSYDFLRAFSFNPSTELLSSNSISSSPTFFNFPGPVPSISANGASNAILWAIQTEGYANGTSEILHAYNASNLGSELYNSSQNAGRDDAGGAVKFAVPTIANGKVYVGAVQKLDVYGLLGGH